jgi:hypothetical protein
MVHEWAPRHPAIHPLTLTPTLIPTLILQPHSPNTNINPPEVIPDPGPAIATLTTSPSSLGASLPLNQSTPGSGTLVSALFPLNNFPAAPPAVSLHSETPSPASPLPESSAYLTPELAVDEEPMHLPRWDATSGGSWRHSCRSQGHLSG